MLTAVHERIHDYVDASKREYQSHDPRALPCAISRVLHTLMERLEHSTHAIDATKAALPDDTEEPAALLTMAREYSLKSERQLTDLAALVLLALERGRAGFTAGR